MIIDKIISYIASLSSIKLVVFATFFVLLGSIPIVYIAAIIGDVEYTKFLLAISVFLPLILTPMVTMLLIRLTTNLKYFQGYLASEIEKNQEKDLMMFEQARFVLMGEMLANISHQWKQPLNTINLSILNLKMAAGADSKDEKYFNIIEDNVNYLATTIDDFMSFFDKRDSMGMQDLCSIVTEVESIINTHIKNKNISLEIEYNFECQTIEIASSISQVILNLLNNAKDALLKVEGERSIKIEFLKHENFLQIIITDNGIGIEEDIQEKIFNPYFTTKEKKQGTGIGLYMSKQIVNKVFDAEIKVMSKERETSFAIEIPYGEKCMLKGLEK